MGATLGGNLVEQLCLWQQLGQSAGGRQCPYPRYVKLTAWDPEAPSFTLRLLLLLSLPSFLAQCPERGGPVVFVGSPGYSA